jgi:phage gp45-like
MIFVVTVLQWQRIIVVKCVQHHNTSRCTIHHNLQYGETMEYFTKYNKSHLSSMSVIAMGCKRVPIISVYNTHPCHAGNNVYDTILKCHVNVKGSPMKFLEITLFLSVCKILLSFVEIQVCSCGIWSRSSNERYTDY